MGQPQSTTITYATTGVCTKTAFASAGTCTGSWTAANKTCVEYMPSLTMAMCTPGTWQAVGGKAPTTTPAPTPDPACACKAGEGCAQSTCSSCVVNKVCSKVFPTKDECLAVTNNAAKWCGN